MTSSSIQTSLVLVMMFSAALADDAHYEYGGHTKLRLVAQAFPDDSVFHELAGASSSDIGGDLRLSFNAGKGHWTFDAAYQFIAVNGESVELSRNLPAGGIFSSRVPNDDRRLFDLTNTMRDDGKTAVLNRLDRLWLGYASEKMVVEFGRQALSWGNGFFYAPMDLVNPFDPTAIDTEFKSGDDMLYSQYLLDNGADVQGAAVFRRNPLSGDVESDEGTVAAKYHGFAGDAEYDILVATSYDDTVVGIGGVYSIGGAVLQGDVVVTDTDRDTYVQVVVNIGRSWVWGGNNVSGVLEYYFNGFGQHGSQYDPLSLAGNPDLVKRLSRGETFALGRNYLAGSLTVELSPLWTITPTVLTNVEDISALLQLITQYSLGDNMTLLASLTIPLGDNGTEFGGIEAGLPDSYLSTDAGLFAQFAFYF